MGDTSYLGKNISVLYRMGNRFYDRVLAPYGIGCGQQFFLLRIYENQGIGMYDLARLGCYDKGTVTRAVKKLEELGYIRSDTDPKDKRVRRLYTTPAATPLVSAVQRARESWNNALTAGMSQEERSEVHRLVERLAENAAVYTPEEIDSDFTLL